MLEFQSQTSVRSNSGVVWIPRTPPPGSATALSVLTGVNVRASPRNKEKCP